MTDVILSSLKSSSLQNSMNSVSEAQPFTYELGVSTVPLAQETVKISADSSVNPAGGQLVSFKLPGSGMLVDGYLKLENTTGVAATPADTAATPTSGGLFSYEYLSLSTRDVELARYSPILLEAESCKGMDTRTLEFAINAGLVNVPVAQRATASVRPYLTPFSLLNFTGAPKDALDLQFLESVYLNAKVKPATEIAVGNADSTVSDLHAVLKYCRMPAENYQEYLNANYSQDKSLSKVMWSSYTESVQTATVAGAGKKSFNMTINCPNYVISTVVKVVPQQVAAGQEAVWASAGGLSAGAKITDIKLSANGKNIVDTHGDVRSYLLGLKQNDLGSDESRFHNWNLAGSAEKPYYDLQATNGDAHAGRANFFEIDYRLLNMGHESRSVDSLEGGISMGALSSKNLTVEWEHNAIYDGDYKIYCVHKILNLVSIDARNGSMSVSTRS